MDSDFFGFIGSFSITGKGLRVDDDFVDRLNHHYTVAVLLIFTVLISAKQYMGSPLSCWIPQYYTDKWSEYAENYCWIKNTYYVRDRIPTDPAERTDQELSYYQWIPFVLALQALLFYTPTLLWRLSNWQTGINVQEIVSKGCEVPSYKTLKLRQTAADNIADHLSESVRLASNHKENCTVKLKRLFFCMCGGQQVGNYLSMLYIVIKILYLANVVGQFFILNSFLGTGDFFGLTLLINLVQGKDWHTSGIFPRVTFCDFRIRAIGQLKPQTIQCVLPVNLFNEKIYIFLWFWFFFVACITAFNTIFWIARIFIPSNSVNYLCNQLKIANIRDCNEADAEEMFKDGVKKDGIFILRLVNANASASVSSMVVKRLWNKHRHLD